VVLEYSGKKVTRADGIATRNNMLDAALEIIVRDGIRGISHRAVAQEAGVKQGSVTYYFADINTLITDAFIRYVELGENSDFNIRKLAAEAMAEYELEGVSERGERILLIDKITRFIIGYFSSQELSEETIILDHAFRNELMRNQTLAKVVRQFDQQDLQLMTEFFSRMGTEDPESDAVQIFSLFWYLAQQLVLENNSDEQKSYTAKIIRRTLRRLLKVD